MDKIKVYKFKNVHKFERVLILPIFLVEQYSFFFFIFSLIL